MRISRPYNKALVGKAVAWALIATFVFSFVPFQALEGILRESNIVDLLYHAAHKEGLVDRAFRALSPEAAEAAALGDGVMVYGERKMLNNGRYHPAAISVWGSGAPTNGDALLFYGNAGNTTPHYRDYSYTNNTFGSEGDTPAENAPVTSHVRTNPTKEEAIAGYVNASGTLQILCYDGTTWTEEWTDAVGGTGTTRRFDIAFERNSGDVMVLYGNNNTATTNELSYRTKSGSNGCGSGNWSAETSFDPVRTSGAVQWVKLEWDPRSAQNVIAAIWADANSDLSGAVWNGTAWVNEPAAVMNAALEVAAAAQDVDSFDLAFESSTGDLLITYGSGGSATANGAFYRACPTGASGNASDCAMGAATAITTMANDATNLDLAANPTSSSNEIVFASIGNAGSDLQVAYWSGSAWTGTNDHDTATATPVAGSHIVTAGWMTASSTTRSVIVYHDSGTQNVGYTAGNGSTFTIQTDAVASPLFHTTQYHYQFEMDPHNRDRGLLLVTDASNDLYVKRVVMTSTPTYTWTNADSSLSLVDYDAPNARVRAYSSTGNSFGAEGTSVAGTQGRRFSIKTSPTKQEAIAGYVDLLGNVQIMCFDGTTWSNEWSVSAGAGTATMERRFDVAYETNSGDAIVLYSGNVATTNELNYRTKAGNTGCGSGNWSGATNLDPVRTSGIVRWVKLATDRRGAQNLVAAAWADANADVSAMVWSGSAWGNEPSSAITTALEQVAAAADIESFDLDYESNSGDLMVVHGSGGTNGTNGAFYSTCTGGTSSCTWTIATAMPTFLDDATTLDLAANPDTASDEMVFVSIGNAGSDLQLGYWSGSAWTNTANADTSATLPIAHGKYVGAGWTKAGSTTRSVVTYYDSAATNIGWYVGNGSTFTVQTDSVPSPVFGVQSYYDLVADPNNPDRLLFVVSDTNYDLFAKRVVMTSTPSFTWSASDGGAALETSLSSRAITDLQSYAYSYWTRVAPTYAQSAYRFFANADSADVGTALAAQDSAATLSASGDAFRLRMLLHVANDQLLVNAAQNFKLQYAARSGTCDTSFSGETYADVTGSTTIMYNNNASVADAAALTANANDPTHGGDTIVNQTYEEANNFTNTQAAVPSGQDAKWDFALKDNGAPTGTAYCFRIVKSDGTALDTVSVVPQVTTASSGPTISFSISDNTVEFGTLDAANDFFADDVGGNASEIEAHQLVASTNASSGYSITVNGTTLTSGGNTVNAIGATNTASATGTEQFGLRMTESGGNGSVKSPYAAAGFALDTAAFPDEVANDADGDDVATTYSVRYLANISATTEAGSYTATLTYVITAAF